MDTLVISENPIHIAKETIVHEIAWGGVTGNIADQTDLNTVLDAFADDLNNLTEEVETKASAAAVVQALSTKADLIDGVIPASQLPSYVDDVLVYPNWSAFPVVGETGKIYVTEDTNKTYRWSGSGYVVIADGVALGETATTAYRGDRGKAAYDHSLSQGNPHNATTSDIPEGGKLYFTDSRVRQTVLSGITFTNKAKVTAADTVETAVGKLQSQLDSTWIKANTVGTVHPNIPVENDFIELARVNGMLWIRGFFKNTGSIINEAQPLFLRIEDINYKVVKRISGSAYMVRIPLNTVGGTIPTLGFGGGSGVCVDAASAATSNQYFSILITTLQAPTDFYHIPPTCLGELVIK